MRHKHSFERVEMTAKAFMQITGLERWQFSRRMTGEFTAPNQKEAIVKLREAGYLADTNRWGVLAESALYRIPEFDFGNLWRTCMAFASKDNWTDGRKVWTEPASPETYNALVELTGDRNFIVTEDTIYWLQTEPFLQYVYPLEISQDNAARLIDCDPGNDLGNAYRLYVDGSKYRALAWTKKYSDDDTIAVLVKDIDQLKVLPNLSKDTLVFIYPLPDGPKFNTTIRMTYDWCYGRSDGPQSYYELAAEVRPEPDSWSDIDVRFSTFEKEAEVNWYGTRRETAGAQTFVRAFQVALNWAERFEKVQVL